MHVIYPDSIIGLLETLAPPHPHPHPRDRMTVRHLWKHYLPATSLAGGKKILMMHNLGIIVQIVCTTWVLKHLSVLWLLLFWMQHRVIYFNDSLISSIFCKPCQMMFIDTKSAINYGCKFQASCFTLPHGKLFYVNISHQNATNSLQIYMSHFAYACKMWYPLNLVLESWEYLWFYWTFCIVILDDGLKLHKLSIHTLVMLQKWLEIH